MTICYSDKKTALRKSSKRRFFEKTIKLPLFLRADSVCLCTLYAIICGCNPFLEFFNTDIYLVDLRSKYRKFK